MIAKPDEDRAARRRPLLERAREIRRIVAAFGNPRSGHGRLLVIEGPAGVGRSRLLLEVAAVARRRHGMNVVPLRLAVTQSATSLPIPRCPPSPGRMLVTVDDAERCDQVSAQRLVRYVADAREHGAVVLIARRDDGGRDRDPWGSGWPGGDGSGEILRLDPLSQRSVSVLLARQLRVVPEDSFGRACHRATGGNPALVHELALALVERAISPIESHTGIVERLALPPVGRRVLARIAPLGRSAMAFAIASAVLGDGMSIADAGALAGVTDDRERSALDALCRHDVLVPSDRVHFAQPLVARSILAAVRPSELCRWRRDAAAILEADDASFEEIAAQLLRAAPAGDRCVVGRLRLGAHRARQVGDHAGAVAHLRRSFEEGVAEFERDLALELAQAHARHSPADAIILLERALRLTSAAARRAPIEAELRRLERELSAAAGA